MSTQRGRNSTKELSYKDALRIARRVGAANADGDALLAQHCFILAPRSALNPAPLYDACKSAGIDAETLMRMAGDPRTVANILFDSWGRK